MVIGILRLQEHAEIFPHFSQAQQGDLHAHVFDVSVAAIGLVNFEPLLDHVVDEYPPDDRLLRQLHAHADAGQVLHSRILVKVVELYGVLDLQKQLIPKNQVRANELC